MRSQWFCALAFSLLLGSAAPSRAAPPARGPDAVQEARSRGEAGLRLFEAGQWAEAFAAFQEADALYHAPTLVLFMARCRRNQGRLIEAQALYQKAAAEPVPRGAPEQFAKAVASARAELDSIRQRIPSARVTIVGAPEEQTAVTIDRVPLSAEEKTSGKALNPGDHEIVAEAEGRASVRKPFSLKEGEAATLELVLQPPPRAPAPPRNARLPAVIALSVGGLGVGLGAVSGGLALSKIADIKSRCTPDGHCLKSDQPAASAAQTLVTASTIGFVAGGAGLAAGALLWWLRPGEPKTPETPAARVEIGVGSITIGGQF